MYSHTFLCFLTLYSSSSLNNSEDSDDDETSFSEDRKKKELTLVKITLELYRIYCLSRCISRFPDFLL